MTKERKSKSFRGFPLAVTLYAGIFLLLIGAGLAWFWGYLAAYEASRPENALNAYMEGLTAQSILAFDADLLDQVDPRVQSREQATQAALQSLSGEFRYIKNAKASVDGHYVYTLLCGKQIVGSFDLVQKKSVGYGFSSWEVYEKSADLSFLLEAPLTLTVPQEFTVEINGNPLPQDAITKKDIPYPLLKECYGSYRLPYLVQYTAGPFIGQPRVWIWDNRDTSCEPILMEELAEPDHFLSHCSDAQSQQLRAAAEAFLKKYIDFTCNTGKDPAGNLAALQSYMLPGSSLQKRMYQALDGLNWVPDRGATLVSVDFHHFVDLGDGHYLCDLTYVVHTARHNGNPQSTTNCKIVFSSARGGFLAETMLNY